MRPWNRSLPRSPGIDRAHCSWSAMAALVGIVTRADVIAALERSS